MTWNSLRTINHITAAVALPVAFLLLVEKTRGDAGAVVLAALLPALPGLLSDGAFVPFRLISYHVVCSAVLLFTKDGTWLTC